MIPSSLATLTIDDHAWFFDFDGTLVELALTPATVRLPQLIRWRIGQFVQAAGGAFALISGRSIDAIDGLLLLPTLPIAGEHGLQRRDNSGRRVQHRVNDRRFREAVSALRALATEVQGVLLEEKRAAVAVHYRMAPAAAGFIEREVLRLAEQAGGEFCVQRGKCVIELRASGASKGTAIRSFMERAPFRGRRPVVVGDDVTDEDAFAAVLDLGGIAVKVGAGVSLAPNRLRDTQSVHRWMDALLRAHSRSATSSTA